MIWLLSLALVYVALVLLLVVFERRFIFFPNYPDRLGGNWQPAGLPVEDVWLTSDGVKLHAWWIAAPQAEFTILYFHGNAANINNRAEIYAFLRTLPANVLALEYRGYGRSEGSPSEAGIYRDADAAYEYVTQQRGAPPGHVIGLGASLGSAVATDLASRKPLGGVVLEAPFGSTAAVARRVYPFLPGLGYFARTKLDTLSKIGKVKAPVLVVHCTQDPVIAIAMGQAVFERASEPKEFLRIEGMCHEGASDVAPDEYRAALLRLLERVRHRSTADQ
jgi:fermentation-respiration switch protein FrsA (DUF1100 family)